MYKSLPALTVMTSLASFRQKFLPSPKGPDAPSGKDARKNFPGANPFGRAFSARKNGRRIREGNARDSSENGQKITHFWTNFPGCKEELALEKVRRVKIARPVSGKNRKLSNRSMSQFCADHLNQLLHLRELSKFTTNFNTTQVNVIVRDSK